MSDTPGTAMVPTNRGGGKLSVSEMQKLSELFVESGLFSDTTSAAEAFVKVMAGQEMGFPPYASMTLIYISNGKPSMTARALAALIKGSGEFDYEWVRSDHEVAELEMFSLKPTRRSIGKVRYTISDAKLAGLLTGPNKGNWTRIPRNMLRARCVSEAFGMHCPHLVRGAAVYLPEELGEVVDEEGKPVKARPVPPVAVIEAEFEAVEVIGPPSRFTRDQQERYEQLVALADEVGAKLERIKEVEGVKDLRSLTPQHWKQVMKKLGVKKGLLGDQQHADSGRDLPVQGGEAEPGEGRQAPVPPCFLAGVPGGRGGDGAGRPDHGRSSGEGGGADDSPLPDQQGGG